MYQNTNKTNFQEFLADKDYVREQTYHRFWGFIDRYICNGKTIAVRINYCDYWVKGEIFQF
jgi:hypothetical protein